MKGRISIMLAFIGSIYGFGYAQVNYMGTSTNNINSSALGLYSNAQGYGALASGYNAVSSGFGAHALGMNAQSAGLYAVAIGTSSFASGNYSMAFGKYVKATGQNAIVIGSGYQTDYLSNNQSNALMVGFLSDRASFYVGPAQGTGSLGRIGIGTNQPESRLDVNAEAANGLCIRTNHSAGGYYGLKIMATHPGTEALTVLYQGDTTLCLRPDGRLFVDNTLVAREVKVRMDVWKDDVFRNPSNIMQLSELKDFVHNHHHLPGIPPEAVVLEKGVDLGELGVVLLEKIEELTLYILQLDEDRQRLERLISQTTQTPKTSTP